jgi:hypothetical protein
MYFLVLTALLQLDDTAPHVISYHATLAECQKEARTANSDDVRLDLPDAKAMGLRFLCLTQASDA